MITALRSMPRWRRWEFGPAELAANPARPVSGRGKSPAPKPAPQLQEEGYPSAREVSTAGGLFIGLFVGTGLWVLLIWGAEWLGPVLFH